MVTGHLPVRPLHRNPSCACVQVKPKLLTRPRLLWADTAPKQPSTLGISEVARARGQHDAEIPVVALHYAALRSLPAPVP